MKKLFVALMVVILAVLDLEPVCQELLMACSAAEAIWVVCFALDVGARSIPTTATTQVIKIYPSTALTRRKSTGNHT